jgi:hypothetical protein
MAEAPQTGDARTVDAWLAEAEGLAAAGKLGQAEAIIARILAAKPDYHPAFHQGAILSWRRKRPRESLARFDRALRLAPGIALYHRNVCEVLRGRGMLDAALAHARRAVALAPMEASGHYNLGVVHYDRLEIDQAVAAERRSLELNPDNPAAHFELAEALLISARFEEGWEEYEWRFRLPGAPPLLPPNNCPQWDGKPMPNGTLMLIGDQGYGDTIQFCRYIPEAAKTCPNIIVACSIEMKPIVTQLPGIARYYDRWQDMPAFDAYCPLSGLPRLFGARLGNIPAPAAYLKAEPERVAYWQRRLDGLIPPGFRRIGLAWAGRPTHGNDFNRSMNLERCGPLLELENTAFVSLQMGAAKAEIGRYFGPAPLINLAENFVDTMAILEGLDRLVAVDTSLAHLAGALGRPVSILLPFAPDWRWLLERSDTPWYPATTLHRQDRPGDWNSALQKAVALIRSTPLLGGE